MQEAVVVGLKAIAGGVLVVAFSLLTSRLKRAGPLRLGGAPAYAPEEARHQSQAQNRIAGHAPGHRRPRLARRRQWNLSLLLFDDGMRPLDFTRFVNRTRDQAQPLGLAGPELIEDRAQQDQVAQQVEPCGEQQEQRELRAVSVETAGEARVHRPGKG